MLSGIESWILQRCGIGSLQELDAWQEQAYQKQVDHAKKSSFYREGLHGFTTSEDLRQDSLRFLCIPPKEVSRSPPCQPPVPAERRNASIFPKKI